MTFEELWSQVQGLPDMAKVGVPEALSESTKKKLSKHSPTEVSEIVLSAIEEINQGSIKTLDELIRNRL